MNHKRGLKNFLVLFMVISLAPFFHACGGANVVPPAETFAEAIADASVPTTAKISKDLTSLLADEPDLVWEGTAGASRLLVITTMSQYAYETFGYKAAYESGADYILGQTVLTWFTAVPKAVTYFKDLGYTAEEVTTLRFAQALGLPEPTGERMVVGLLVNVADTFRPCPDPEVNDHECELDYPTNYSGDLIEFDPATLIWESTACNAAGCIYNDWFDNRRATVYTGASAFPFTQLGYTYDWGVDAPAMHIGLSEFAVKGGSTFKVVSADTTPDYFVNNWDLY